MDRFTKKEFLSNDSWTCPAGVTQVLAFGMGGGAGGRAGSLGGFTTGSVGGHGGLGQHLQPVLLTVVPNTTYTITIGDGGLGGPLNGQAGTAGGDTSFGALMTWKGAPVTFGLGANSVPRGTGVMSYPGGTASNMVAYPAGGQGSAANQNNAQLGYAGFSGLSAAPGSGPITSTTGGNGGSGMSGEEAGGTGGSGQTGDVGLPGGNAPANSGAGGGGGAGGGSPSKTGGAGGNGGSGKLILMWVE